MTRSRAGLSPGDQKPAHRSETRPQHPDHRPTQPVCWRWFLRESSSDPVVIVTLRNISSADRRAHPRRSGRPGRPRCSRDSGAPIRSLCAPRSTGSAWWADVGRHCQRGGAGWGDGRSGGDRI